MFDKLINRLANHNDSTNNPKNEFKNESKNKDPLDGEYDFLDDYDSDDFNSDGSDSEEDDDYYTDGFDDVDFIKGEEEKSEEAHDTSEPKEEIVTRVNKALKRHPRH